MSWKKDFYAYFESGLHQFNPETFLMEPVWDAEYEFVSMLEHRGIENSFVRGERLIVLGAIESKGDRFADVDVVLRRAADDDFVFVRLEVAGLIVLDDDEIGHGPLLEPRAKTLAGPLSAMAAS